MLKHGNHISQFSTLFSITHYKIEVVNRCIVVIFRIKLPGLPWEYNTSPTLRTSPSQQPRDLTFNSSSCHSTTSRRTPLLVPGTPLESIHVTQNMNRKGLQLNDTVDPRRSTVCQDNIVLLNFSNPNHLVYLILGNPMIFRQKLT